MSAPISLLDKQEIKTAREWVRIMREEGPEALQAAMEAHSERRARLRSPAAILKAKAQGEGG